MRDPVLDAVIEITRHRTLDALACSVLASLSKLTSAEELRLYRARSNDSPELEQTLSLIVSAQGDGTPLPHWDSEPQPAGAESEVLRCIESGRTERIRKRDHWRTLFPLLQEGRTIGVLALHSREPLQSPGHLIEGLLGVYANYLTILDEGARDKLTGLLNRSTFEERLQRLLKKQRLQNERERAEVADRRRRVCDPSLPAWLAILDIDRFKRINDSLGHLYGDEVILTVAQLMRRCFRQRDLLFRFGGEEFVIVLEPAPAEMAQRALERFRTTVESHPFPQLGTVTISIGYAGIMPGDHGPLCLERADRALYFAKENGRNATHRYEFLVQSGEIPAAHQTGTVELF